MLQRGFDSWQAPHICSFVAAFLQDHGKTSATASLGMITLWDVEGGLPQIDKYLYSRDNHVVAGEYGFSHLTRQIC